MLANVGNFSWSICISVFVCAFGNIDRVIERERHREREKKWSAWIFVKGRE